MGAPAGNQGIYRITSPSLKTYIGQSVNFKVRFAKYKLLHCEGQKRLYNSFKKYGIDNHVFEIIETCCESMLNERERYWQDNYNCIGVNGLNCKLTKTDVYKGRHSEETKKKISESNKGKKHTEEWITRQSERKKNMSNETKDKIRNANIGKKVSDSVKEKLRLRMIGNNYTKGVIPINARKIINKNTGEIFNSITIAAEKYGYNPRTLTAWVDGQNKNKSSLILYYGT